MTVRTGKMLYIDGAHGEGGGQILRTSLTLAAITGQPFHLDRLRANRKKPGLAPQHLTAVRAVAALCDADVRGGELGSTTLEFCPTCPPKAGPYRFDVTEAREGGSAGSVTLILQALLLPLALAPGDSTVLLKGGTHVPWSPPVTYIEGVYLPVLELVGIRAGVQLRRWGWYPQGGGEVELRVRGNSQLKGLQLLERGELRQVRGLAAVTELPSHVPQRMASRAENLLEQAGLDCPVQVQPWRGKGLAPGAGFFLTAEYSGTRAGFSALGRRGLPAERVAEMAVEAFLDFQATGAPADPFLGDQLLLPVALGSEASQYRVAEVTEHLRTNAWAIEQFGLAEIAIAEEVGVVSLQPWG